jgi:hypothetical protein
MSEVKVEVAEYKYEYQGFVVFVKFVNNHATIKSIHNAYEISTIRLDAKYLTAIAKIFEKIAEDLEKLNHPVFSAKSAKDLFQLCHYQQNKDRNHV